MRERQRNQTIATRNMIKKKNESSTKQVELSYLKEEIKYIKRPLDILLERQWLETSKDSKEDSTEIKKNSENQTETNQKHRDQ